MEIKTLSTQFKKVYQLDCTTWKEVEKMKVIKKKIKEYNSLFDLKLSAKWLDSRKFRSSPEVRAIWAVTADTSDMFEATTGIFEDIVSEV
jgi:hypothetical protein